MRWLITNRNVEADGFGCKQAKLTYWMLKQPGLPLDQFSSWNKVQAKDFRDALRDAADKFPHPVTVEPEDQKHVCLFIHGYNNSWTSAMGTYGNVASRLFNDESADSLGELIPSTGPPRASSGATCPTGKRRAKLPTTSPMFSLICTTGCWSSSKSRKRILTRPARPRPPSSRTVWATSRWKTP